MSRANVLIRLFRAVAGRVTAVRTDNRSAQEFRGLTGGVSVRMSREN
jgi:hypothetical protein